jgi:DNA helicase-2/ATP-dependent DNA helicase PcrA
MAVLARTNAQLGELAQGLDLVEIPYRIAGDETAPTTATEDRDLPTVASTSPPPGVAEAVTLSSFHRAKGLEWNLVMLTGIEEGLVPFGRAASREQTDEEQRLLYVAMTRAVEELHLSWSKVRYFGGRPVEREPCRWLDELARTPTQRSAAAALDAALSHTTQGATPPPAQGSFARGTFASTKRRRDPSDPVATLCDAIVAWRRDTARFSGVVPHLLLHDTTIEAIAEIKPRSIDELAAVPGVGPVKAHRYGPQILELLSREH